MTRPDDDFLARTEPLAEPRGGGLELGASGYAEGLRRTRAERRASRHNNRRETHKAFVVAAGVMGTAVVAAAVFAMLVFAGVVDVSTGVGGSHRTETPVKHPSSTTTDPPSPSTTTVPPSPDTTTAPVSPDTATQTERSPLPPSNPVAGAQVLAPPSLNSNGSQPLSSASSLSPSGAPAPALTTAPAASPTCHGPKKSPKGRVAKPSRC